MSDISDIVDRAEAALEGVTEGEWVQVGLGNIHRLPVGEYPPVAKTWRQSDGDFIAEARSLIPALLAEVERLHSWQGLMSLLDEHYPETIFPTTEDREDRDSGPRITSLLRNVDKLEKELAHQRRLKEYFSGDMYSGGSDV